MAHYIITRETWDINGDVVERVSDTGIAPTGVRFASGVRL